MVSARLGVLVVAGLGLATALCGCGASQVAQEVDPVAKAASITESVPGYRMAMSMTFSNHLVGTATASATGVFDRTPRRGAMSMSEAVAGHQLSFRMLFGGTTAYMAFSGVPGASTLTHGKSWVKIDYRRVLSAEGLGGLPVNGNDPRQFLDYLRAAGGSATRVGTGTIRGVATTHYRVTLDLDRYTRLVPAAQQSSARRGVALLESVVGSHRLPADVWLDSARRVRQMQFRYTECVSGQHLDLGLIFDLFNYGPQPVIQLPSPSETYDATPLLAKRASSLKLGC